MAARTIKINIKLPKGVTATDDLVSKATAAAESVIADSVSELKEAIGLAKQLSRKGIEITAEEILARKSSKSAPTKSATSANSATRKRVVLSAAQKKSVVAELKKGAKAAALADKFGVSHATVMNIKRSAGLTKARK